MIKLTNAHTQQSIYVNPIHIVSFCLKSQFNGTMATAITLDNSSKPVIDVTESPEAINSMLTNKFSNDNLSIDTVIEYLNNLQIDGETTAYIIQEIGMSDQLLKQLIMSANPKILEFLYAEKASLMSKELNNNLMYKY